MATVVVKQATTSREIVTRPLSQRTKNRRENEWKGAEDAELVYEDGRARIQTRSMDSGLGSFSTSGCTKTLPSQKTKLKS